MLSSIRLYSRLEDTCSRKEDDCSRIEDNYSRIEDNYSRIEDNKVLSRASYRLYEAT